MLTPAQLEAIRPELQDIARRQRASANAYYAMHHCIACHTPVPLSTYSRPHRCPDCRKDNP